MFSECFRAARLVHPQTRQRVGAFDDGRALPMKNDYSVCLRTGHKSL